MSTMENNEETGRMSFYKLLKVLSDFCWSHELFNDPLGDEESLGHALRVFSSVISGYNNKENDLDPFDAQEQQGVIEEKLRVLIKAHLGKDAFGV